MMAAEFERDELRDLVIDSYELILKIPTPENKDGKYEIRSRGKLKNLPEALREFEDAQSSITHFIKSASYLLPRSTDGNLSKFLSVMLEKVQNIQENEEDPEKVRDKIRYLIGYSNWGMDSVCYIFTEGKTEDEIKLRLQKMIGAEMKALGAEEKTAELVENILKWKRREENRRR